MSYSSINLHPARLPCLTIVKIYTIVTLTASTMNRNLQIRQPDRTFTSSVVIIVDQCTVLMVIHWPARDTTEDFVDKVLSNVFRRLRTSDVNTTCGSHYHDTNNCECSSRSRSQVCPQYKLHSHTDVLGLYTRWHARVSPARTSPFAALCRRVTH